MQEDGLNLYPWPSTSSQPLMLFGNAQPIHLSIPKVTLSSSSLVNFIALSTSTLRHHLHTDFASYFTKKRDAIRRQCPQILPPHGLLYLLYHPFCYWVWTGDNDRPFCTPNLILYPLLMYSIPATVPSQPWSHFPTQLDYFHHWKSFYYFSHLKKKSKSSNPTSSSSISRGRCRIFTFLSIAWTSGSYV